MKYLKKRKTPLQSKRKIISMITLFEKCIDEKIVLINVELNTIQSTESLYKVDIHNNKVEKISYEMYELKINEPFD